MVEQRQTRRDRQIYPVPAVLALLLLLSTARLVRADAAPPWYAQGSAVNPDDVPTHVQMVFEEVLLVIQGKEEDPSAWLASRRHTRIER